MNKENKILESLTGLQKASAPNFFYNHLISKMQHSIEEKTISFSLRPVFSTLLLCILLTVNIFSLTQFSKKAPTESFPQAKQSLTIDVFADAYNMNTETIYQ